MRSISVSLLTKSSMRSGSMPARKPSCSRTLGEGASLPRFSLIDGYSDDVPSDKLHERLGHKCFTGKSTEAEK